MPNQAGQATTGQPPMNAPRTDSSASATPTHNSEKHLDSSPADGLSRRVKIVAAVVVLGVIMSVLDTRSSMSRWTRYRAICTRR